MNNKSAWHVVVWVAVLATSASLAPADDAVTFDRDVRPLLTRHCVKCHGGEDPAGGMRLDASEASFADAKAREGWEKVYSQLVRGGMPPPEMPRLNPDELEVVTSWIRRESERGLIAERGGAGRTVMRRLTRVEYARLLEDVLGLHFKNVRLNLHERLPIDPQSPELVNDGELLNFQNLHLKSYVDLAERVVAAAITDEPRPEPFTYRIDPRSLKINGDELRGHVAPHEHAGKSWLAFVMLRSSERTDAGGVRMPPRYDSFGGGISHSGAWNISVPFFRPTGVLRIRIRAGAIIPPGEGAPVMRVSLNNEMANEKFILDVASITVANPADELRDYEIEVPLELVDFPYIFCERSGQMLVQIGNEYVPLGDRIMPPREKGAANVWPWEEPRLVIDEVVITGPGSGQWPPELHRAVTAAGENIADDELRATAILRDVAAKAWRRPVTADEIGPFVALYKQRLADGQSRDGGLREPLVAILVSPQAVYLVEHKAARPAALSGMELANRMSFFLWGGRPDGELSGLGISGKLRDPAVLASQVERMLDDSRSEVFITEFVTRLLALERLEHDPINFDLHVRTFSKARVAEVREQRLEHDLALEPVRYFGHVLRNNRPVHELIGSDYLIVNDRLAKYYGLAEVEGGEFRVVPAPEDRRRGWLTMAGVVAAASRGNKEATILRGVYLLDRFLGEHPGVPPGNVEPLEAQAKVEKKRKSLPLREQVALHTAVNTCALCHRKIDPLGFVWAEFDHLGQKAARPAGKPDTPAPVVDCSGKLPDGRAFADLAEFAELLNVRKESAGSTGRYQFGEVLIRRLTAYALSRPLNLADDKLISSLVQRAESDGWRLREIIKAIIGSESFTSG